MAGGEQQMKIEAFTEIVGIAGDKARLFLQATNWQLEDAIQLFYAGDEYGGGAPASRDLELAPWNDLAAKPVESGPGPMSSSAVEHGDDYVRPPLPVKREALYEDIFEYQAHHMAQSSNQPSSVDVFRNFQDEASFRSVHAPSSDASSVEVNEDTLAALYRPPFTLMFQGSFEQAKVEAAKQAKWLLVNLQSTKEFSSYMLNRDTWAHEIVKDLVGSSFIFWQIYDNTKEGTKVCTYYKLTNIPTIMILDPLTGQRMRSWEGMIGAEHLLEDLVLYLDRGPLENPQTSFPPQKRPRESTYTSKESPKSVSHVDEEEELQQAMAASLKDTREHQEEEKVHLDKNGSIHTEVEDGWAVPFINEPLSHSKLTYPVLPEEPWQTDGTVCRVAIRFPDGKRGQRRLLRSDPIQVLWSFCVSQVEEAANGRSFRLTNMIPGVIGGALDFGVQASIGEAGLANSMLLMTWD